MNPTSTQHNPVSPSTQAFVAIAIFMGLMSTVFWLTKTSTRGVVDYDAPPHAFIHFTADINTADVAELSQIPGLGPTLASRIIHHRTTFGEFSSHEALVNVPGIGPSTLSKMKPYLRFIGTSTPPPDNLSSSVSDPTP